MQFFEELNNQVESFINCFECDSKYSFILCCKKFSPKPQSPCAYETHSELLKIVKN